LPDGESTRAVVDDFRGRDAVEEFVRLPRGLRVSVVCLASIRRSTVTLTFALSIVERAGVTSRMGLESGDVDVRIDAEMSVGAAIGSVGSAAGVALAAGVGTCVALVAPAARSVGSMTASSPFCVPSPSVVDSASATSLVSLLVSSGVTLAEEFNSLSWVREREARYSRAAMSV
jgi:hypothetical protein